MVVNREDAKAAATNPEYSDPHFLQKIVEGGQLRIDLEKEANRHREAMASGERGGLGRLLGGEKHAPTTVAFIAVIIGASVWICCLFAAKNVGSVEGGAVMADFWSEQGNRALAFALTALGYIFGRGSSK